LREPQNLSTPFGFHFDVLGNFEVCKQGMKVIPLEMIIRFPNHEAIPFEGILA